MKLVTLISLLLILSSCWPEYRQLDSNNKPVKQPEAIASPNYAIQMYLHKKVRGDTADYHVYVVVKPLNNDIHLKTSDIKVTLSAYPSGKPCPPLDIKYMVDKNVPGHYGVWIPPVPTPTDTSQTLDFKVGNRYTLVYAFSGRNHHKFKLDVNADINGETGKKSLLLEKYTEVQIFH